MNSSDRLRVLAAAARELGSSALADEADTLVERVREGRFYVACVGQFKRGKSTLLNALVGVSVLPTGVVPITTAVTVLRYGEQLAARVRFRSRDWESCDPATLATYVSEEHNRGNEKGVTGVEVFVRSPLLESGMCLVDTPGIGSVFEANSAATRAFVPHIDAALVVLGVDPPVSGEELALIEDVAKNVKELVFVINKADRSTEIERSEARAFTVRVFEERLHRGVDQLLDVSAIERVAGHGLRRDWDGLVSTLETLARDAGVDLVRAAEQRGIAALTERLRGQIDEHEAALVRPLEETEARVEALRRIVHDAEESMGELGHRLTAVQERLARTFIEERDRFFTEARPEAERELRALVEADRGPARTLRRRAVDGARSVATRCLERWRQAQEPRAAASYLEAVARFVELFDDFRERLARAGASAVATLDAEIGFAGRSRFHFTEMLTIAPSSMASAWLDVLTPRSWRTRVIQRDAVAYLERLLEVNAARVTNDLRDRIAESRRRLESAIRARLVELSLTAERALQNARRAQLEGADVVQGRLEALRQVRAEIGRV